MSIGLHRVESVGFHRVESVGFHRVESVGFHRRVYRFSQGGVCRF